MISCSLFVIFIHLFSSWQRQHMEQSISDALHTLSSSSEASTVYTSHLGHGVVVNTVLSQLTSGVNQSSDSDLADCVCVCVCVCAVGPSR
jgi:hypothetical protein